MVLVKVIKNTYGKIEYVQNACNYVGDERAIGLYGYGVSADKDAAFEQMMATKEYYGKTNDNPLIHIVASYQGHVTSDADACALTRELSEYYADNYQVFAGAHAEDRGDSHYHSHIIINSVGIRDGKIFNSSPKNMLEFKKHVEKVTNDTVTLEFKNKDPFKDIRRSI